MSKEKWGKRKSDNQSYPKSTRVPTGRGGRYEPTTPPTRAHLVHSEPPTNNQQSFEIEAPNPRMAIGLAATQAGWAKYTVVDCHWNENKKLWDITLKQGR